MMIINPLHQQQLAQQELAELNLQFFANLRILGNIIKWWLRFSLADMSIQRS